MSRPGEDGLTSFAETYLAETARIVAAIDRDAIDRVAHALAAVREGGGRLFVLGVGGSAAHASHAAADFRKLCHLESYAPTDNVAELTARINDDGWEDALAAWLEGSHIREADAVLVFSVGGGSAEQGVSVNLVRRSTRLAEQARRSSVSWAATAATHEPSPTSLCRSPVVSEDRVTPHTEGHVRRRLAPAREPSGAPGQTAKWESLR